MALIAGLSVLAKRWSLPIASLMLLSGVAIGFSGLLPRLELDPETVLTILLPPLLYLSGVGMSWRGFRSNIRAILLLAVGCVLFTAAGVALVSQWVLRLPLAIGFVLGAIVSPPDAVAAAAILRHLSLPRKVVTILEGESLVNDATALVALTFAVGAVATGTFSPAAALGKFSLIVSGEVVWGAAIGWVVLRLRHLANDARAEILIALATPFAAFWPPHFTGGSGVIACVVAGLWVSWNGRDLIRPATRLQGFFIWDLIGWSVQSLVFLLTGLQAREVVRAFSTDGLARAILSSLLVTATVILVRFIWMYPATYLSRLIPQVRRDDPAPNWRVPLVLGASGLRGVVSLAAALSLPLTTPHGPFPDRDLILFITFVVICLTLLGGSAVLPSIVRGLWLSRVGAEQNAENRRDERVARIRGVDAALAALNNEEASHVPSEAIEALRRHELGRRDHMVRSADAENPDDPVAISGHLKLRLLGAERSAISSAYTENRLTDAARRRIERELDLEEARLLAQMASGGVDDYIPDE